MEKKYVDISCFHGDFATVAMNMNGQKKWGLINKSEQEIIPTIYDLATYKGEDVMYVNIGYKNVHKQKRFRRKTTHGLWMWMGDIHPGKWGIVNLKNETIVPPIYSYLNPFGNGFASASRGKKKGLINKYGKILSPFNYDLILPIKRKEEILFKFMNTEGVGVMDSNGKIVLDPVYNWIDGGSINDSEEWIAVKKGDEYYYLDKQWKRCCL